MLHSFQGRILKAFGLTLYCLLGSEPMRKISISESVQTGIQCKGNLLLGVEELSVMADACNVRAEGMVKTCGSLVLPGQPVWSTWCILGKDSMVTRQQKKASAQRASTFGHIHASTPTYPSTFTKPQRSTGNLHFLCTQGDIPSNGPDVFHLRCLVSFLLYV